ncbi:MAG: hypothetical protein AAF197_10945, partial [Pseudomonadota bacterium]
MADQVQRGRLIWILCGIALLILVVIWFVTNLSRLSDEHQISRVDVSLKTAAEEDLSELTKHNTSEAYISGIEARNRKEAETARKTGKSHVDRLVDGIEIDQLEFNPELELIKKQLASLQDSHASLQEQLRRNSRARSTVNRTAKNQIDKYTGFDGVDSLSNEYRAKEAEAIGQAFDQIMRVNLIGMEGTAVSPHVPSREVAKRDLGSNDSLDTADRQHQQAIANT